MYSLQSYLALIDPMLFVVLKTIRRILEQFELEWAIGGDISMYLYSYMTGLPPVNLDSRALDLRIKVTEVKHVSYLKGFISELLKSGFQVVSDSVLMYPLCSIRIDITEVKDLNVIRMQNAKGKYTYPLLRAETVIDEKEEYIKKLPLSEKNVQLEVHNWMKEVMNYLIIE